jgi:hypothetical protein
MWSIRVATGGALLAVAVVSAAAQSARTSPAGAPLPLLTINEGPIVDPSPVQADPPARQAPAKQSHKSAAAAGPRPAPSPPAATARQTSPWPEAYADTPSLMTAHPEATPPGSTSAKPAAKSVERPGPGKPAKREVVEWNAVKAPDLAADHPKPAAPLAATSVFAQPQQAVAAMVPAVETQPTVPMMVATPERELETAASGTAWMSQAAFGGALGGGIVGAAMLWFLMGSRTKHAEASETEKGRRPTGYNWAAAYNDGWEE